ncbi:MAG: sulfotransferase family 2 domain-containing protein [Candidatus Competibacteraceae bacterium]
MINHKHRYIFIHIPKMAGTSIQQALGNENTSTVRPNHHGRLHEYQRVYGTPTVREYTTFTVIRNPWDLEVSAYCYNAQLERSEAELEGIRTRNSYWYELIRFCKTHSFAAYVRSPYWFTDAPIEEFITLDGVYAIDHYLRFEQLSMDFNALCCRLGLSPRPLPHVNPSRHSMYQAYYDDATRALVSERYEDYIRRFGYRFEN